MTLAQNKYHSVCAYTLKRVFIGGVLYKRAIFYAYIMPIVCTSKSISRLSRPTGNSVDKRL